MIDYQLGLAWRSLKRNPVLSVLSIAGIGLGIAVSMMFVTADYYLNGDPIPEKSDRLFAVHLDAWDPARPYDDDNPNEPPDQLTSKDAMALMNSDVPTYRTAMHKAELTVYPEREDLRPFRSLTRMCFADFFPMFDVPFRYGAGWRREDDEGPEAVAVLDAETNQKLFGGENSVGKSVRIEGRDFRVVGVLDPWRPLPKYYDLTNGEFDRPEGVYVPFHFGRVLEIYTAGNTSSWGGWSNYAGLLQSEAIWLQYWVQLDDAKQREAYQAWIAGYAAEQQKLGRMARAQNNKVRDVMTWLRDAEAAPEEARTLMIIALLFLLICSVNLIGILLGKFLARAPEIGGRRALGASRRQVFAQHLLECGVIGVCGAIVGLMVTPAGLALIDRLFDQQFGFRLDPTLFAVALALALTAAFIAGVYPAWRVCRTPPALHLKTQ